MAEKRLIVVVDSSVEMGPHWNIILLNYLEKIIRRFCGDDQISQGISAAKPSLCLITYGAHGHYNVCEVQASVWMRNLDTFLQWLSDIGFNGGGFNEYGVSEGLSKALLVFQRIPNENQPQKFGMWHCILVAASNLDLLHSKIRLSGFGETSTGQLKPRVVNPEIVARSFAPFFVSMSVICPKNIPGFREIYYAGNNYQEQAKESSDGYDPNYTVLLSNNFFDAHVALCQHLLDSSDPSLTKFSEEDIELFWNTWGKPETSQNETPRGNTSTAPIPPNGENEKFDEVEDVAIFQETVNELPINQQEIWRGNIPTTSGLQEMGEDKSEDDELGESWTSGPNKVPAKDFISEISPNVNKASNFFSSPSNSGSEKFKMELTPLGIVLKQNTHNQTSETVKPSLASNLTLQSTRFSTNGSIDPAIFGNVNTLQPKRFQTMGSFPQGLSQVLPTINMSGSLGSTSHNARSTTTGLFPHAPLNMYENPGISQPFANHEENGLKRTHSNAFGLPNISHGIGSSNPAVRKSQELQNENGLSFVTNTLDSGSRDLPHVPPNGYVKAWEGDLTSKENGRIVLVNRLVAYRKETSSPLIGTNWPHRLHMDQLISSNYLNNIPYEGELDYLIFEAVNDDGILAQLEEKRLRVYIKLHPQTLIISETKMKSRFVGTLYHTGYPLYRHQIYNSPADSREATTSSAAATKP